VSMYALPIAHAGHWLTGLLYFAPVVVVVGALAWQSMKDRHADDEEPGDVAS